MNATLTGWIIRLFRVRHYNQIEELRRENTILQEKLQQVQDEKRQKEERISNLEYLEDQLQKMGVQLKNKLSNQHKVLENEVVVPTKFSLDNEAEEPSEPTQIICSLVPRIKQISILL